MEKYLLDILAVLRKRLFFIDGLVVLLFLASSLFYWIAQEVGYRLIQIWKTYGFPIADGYAHSFFLISFLIILSLTFILWHRFRSIPKFAKNELGIIFAPDFDEEVEKEVNRLFINLTQEIKSREIGNRFKLKRMPPNLSICSASEAIAILRKAGGAVAVWGPLEYQEDENGRTTGFSRFSITFIHRKTRLSMSHFETLAMSLIGRQFHIRDKTQIVDRNIVARDIGLVVRNALGVKLLIDLKFQEAVKIYGPLHLDLQAIFPGKRPVPLQRFCSQVQYDFAYSLTMATSKEYREFLFNERLFEIPKSLLSGWLKIIDQAISLDPQNSMHYVSKGILLFLQGDVEGAIRAEKKAEKLAPKALSAPNFSLAFLYNFTGKLKLSRNQYRIGLAKKTSYDEEMVSQCIMFTRQSIERFKEKRQLLLALAVLEIRRGSKKAGIKAIEEMLADPPQAPELDGFIKEAENLLEQVKSDRDLD